MEVAVWPDADLVAVYRTADCAMLPVIKSVLDSADIPYVVQGEEALGLHPIARSAGRMAQRALSTIVFVPPERADEARELLQNETHEGEFASS